MTNPPATLSFTLIQANLHWQNKQANLQMFADKIAALTQKKEVVLLPEMFSTGFSMQAQELAEKTDGETVQWMRQLAQQYNIIIGGSLIIEADGKYYNQFIWMQPNGVFAQYNKKHLFAFAGEDKFYTAGNSRCIVQVKGWKILLQVCYDLRFPVWARQQTQQGEPEYDAIVYVANWPERRNHAWKTLLTARAIENQCYVVAVNRVGNDGNEIYHSGDSMIINALGEVLYEKARDEDCFTTTLDKQSLIEIRNKLPFLKDADGFNILNG
jgi:omega-amidase